MRVTSLLCQRSELAEPSGNVKYCKCRHTLGTAKCRVTSMGAWAVYKLADYHANKRGVQKAKSVIQFSDVGRCCCHRRHHHLDGRCFSLTKGSLFLHQERPAANQSWSNLKRSRYNHLFLSPLETWIGGEGGREGTTMPR